MSLRVAHMGVASGIRAASSKCCMRSPEGPAAVPFGKERRVDKISKLGPTEIGIVFHHIHVLPLSIAIDAGYLQLSFYILSLFYFSYVLYYSKIF